jgi:hypothetical protein
MLSNAKDWISWIMVGNRRQIVLLVGGGLVVVAGAAWGIFTYWNHPRQAELLTYRLCIGSQRERCPKDATFVRDEGEDTAARWTQRQCAGYKTRRIIISDASPECACQLADVSCMSE